MVIKLLSLSLWMSIAVYGMDPAIPSAIQGSGLKIPKIYTGIENITEKIRADAFKEGLQVGRAQGQGQINTLLAEQELLLKLVASKTEMNQKLCGDLQQTQSCLQELQSSIAAMACQLQELIGHHSSFRQKPADQIAKLQDLIAELKKLAY